MHHLKLKSALEKFQEIDKSLPKDEVISTILAHANGYSAQDAEDIYTALMKTVQPPAEESTQEHSSVQQSGYPLYDLWQIDVVASSHEDEKKGKKLYDFTPVKKLRTNVKLEHHLANRLNEQSHNNGRRYYCINTIQPGQTETVSVNL